jgi:hypothetical protein
MEISALHLVDISHTLFQNNVQRGTRNNGLFFWLHVNSNSLENSMTKNLTTHLLWRMLSSELLHRMALVISDISEECSPSIIRATRIGEQE